MNTRGYRELKENFVEGLDRHQLRAWEFSEMHAKIMREVKHQEWEYGTEMDVPPHQMLGLIQEEIGEFAQALNETFIPNQKDPIFAGLDNIEEEGLQAIALIIRTIANLNIKYKDCKRDECLVGKKVVEPKEELKQEEPKAEAKGEEVDSEREARRDEIIDRISGEITKAIMMDVVKKQMAANMAGQEEGANSQEDKEEDLDGIELEGDAICKIIVKLGESLKEKEQAEN